MVVPERFELGTLPYVILAGITAAVDFIADLVPSEGTRRERLTKSLHAMDEHEQVLRARLRGGLEAMDGITIYSNAPRKTPTELFSVRGVEGAKVYAHLAELGVNAPAGNFYAIECSRHLGLGDTGGVRAGLAPYNTTDDIDRLLAGLAELLA